MPSGRGRRTRRSEAEASSALVCGALIVHSSSSSRSTSSCMFGPRIVVSEVFSGFKNWVAEDRRCDIALGGDLELEPVCLHGAHHATWYGIAQYTSRWSRRNKMNGQMQENVENVVSRGERGSRQA